MGDLGIVLAVIAGAIAQSISGIGFGLVAGPFLIASLGHDGLRTSVMLGSVVNLTGLVGRHRSVLVRRAIAIWIPAALTTPLVSILVRSADTTMLAMAAGILTLAAAFALARGWRAPRLTGRAGAAAAGMASGSLTAIAGIGGPPVAMYAVNAGWPTANRTPTLQAYFFALNMVALASLGPPHLRPILFLGLAAGLLIGRLVAQRLDEDHARGATLALAAASGFVALVRGITRL